MSLRKLSATKEEMVAAIERAIHSSARDYRGLQQDHRRALTFAATYIDRSAPDGSVFELAPDDPPPEPPEPPEPDPAPAPAPPKPPAPLPAALEQNSGDLCRECNGFNLVRTGTCLTCQACGTTTGCS